MRFNKIHCFIIVYLILGNYGCASQTRTIFTNDDYVAKTRSAVPNPIDEAEIKVYEPEFEASDTTLETVLASELPKINFTFKGNDRDKEDISNVNVFEILISDADKHIFYEFWKEALRYRYETIFKKNKINRDIYYSMTIKFSNISSKFNEDLTKLCIAAPNGKRTISIGEASEITKGINLASANVIKKLE